MKQKLFAITIIMLAVFCVQAFAKEITVTVNSPEGNPYAKQIDGHDNEEEFSQIYLQEEKEKCRLNNFRYDNSKKLTRFLMTGEKFDSADDMGTLAFSSKETKNIKVNLNKKINVNMLNIPEEYQFDIYTVESICEKDNNVDVFHIWGIHEDKEYVYLPDFSEDYILDIFSCPGETGYCEGFKEYIYGPVKLKNSDTIKVDGFDVYLNGKKLDYERFDENTPTYKLKTEEPVCFSFMDGVTEEPNYITLTINSPEGYLLWGNNLRKELNNYEYLNDPQAKGKKFTSIELTQDASYTTINRGIISFSTEENKPININMDRRIGINFKNFPKGYSAKIYSEEDVCDKEGKRLQEIFHAPLDPMLDETFYLPDFTNNFKMMIWTLDSKYMQKGYLYDLPDLKYGYLIQVNEFTLLLNGKEVQKEYFENKGKDFPPADCYTFSEDWTRPIDKNLSEEKVNIKFELQVKDFYTDQPINRASVYFNNKLIGVTSSKGMIDDALLVNKNNKNELKISAAGYKPLTQEISGKENLKLSVTLKPQYEPFEIPKGYENYVTANKIYGWVKQKDENKAKKNHISIHPSEPKLRAYSFPIISNEKKTVLNQVISKVNSKQSPLLEYDHSCVPEVQENCQAWHDSDYEVLEIKKGVCADFATLAVSFGNSYQIPTREVSVSYKRKDPLERELYGNFSKHAFGEVYLSEEEGWKNFDITWKVLDKPCAYAKRGDCFVEAKVMNEDESKETDLTGIYACNKLCDKDEITDEAALEMPPAEVITSKDTLLIDISSDKATLEYRKILGKEDSEKILQIYESESFDSNAIAKEISDNIKEGFRQKITISNLKFVLDKKNKEQIKVGIDFEFEIPPDELVYTFNTYQEEYDITLITPKNIKAVLPSFDSKETTSNSIKYEFYFGEPGEHTIYAIFNHKKSAIVSNDPLHKALADVLSGHINAKSYTLEEQIPNVERIYIIGDYSYIPSSVEDSLIEKNIEVVRFENDDKYISAQIAQGFWQSADEVAIANMYDYASVEEARNYAVDKDIPLLFVGPDEIPNYIQKAIGFTGATKTTIKDPKNKIGFSIDEDISREVESSGKTGYMIVVVLVILIAALLAYKFIKPKAKKSKVKK